MQVCQELCWIRDRRTALGVESLILAMGMAAVNWLSVPFAKSLVTTLSSAEKERVGSEGPRTISKVLAPSMNRMCLKNKSLWKVKR